MSAQPTAILYRMALPEHVCPFGKRAKAMLEAAGYAVDDRVLGSRTETDAFKAERGVETTPQIKIGDDWINGSDALQDYLRVA